MQVVTYLTHIEQIDFFVSAGLKEVILTHKDLSRQSKCCTEEFNELALAAQACGLKVVLEWDILATEFDFARAVQEFEKLKAINAIRVQDPGFALYVWEHTELGIQLILETGNHNLIGLQAWCKRFGERLERIAISNQISKNQILLYSKELETPIEILGWGRILIFYSPRKLVTIQDRFEFLENYAEVTAESQESPHKGFTIVENQHGSFMFHPKELYLLDRYNDILELGLGALRLDLRHRDPAVLKSFFQCEPLDAEFQKLKTRLAQESMRGYFLVNKSDVLFDKLKNKKIAKRDAGYLGEVVDASKGKYTAILATNVISTGDMIKIINPDGKEKIIKVDVLKNSYDRIIPSGKDLLLIDYVGGIWVKAQIYQNEKTQGESIPCAYE